MSIVNENGIPKEGSLYFGACQDSMPTEDNSVRDIYKFQPLTLDDRSVDIRKFSNYDAVKQNIVCKLINTERNKNLLEDVPHIEFLDLSVIFLCMAKQDAYLSVRNVYLPLWGVTVEELYQAAKQNMQRIIGYEIKSITEVVHELAQEEDIDCEEYMTEDMDNVPMYVLSSKNRVYGAACILYPDVIHNFANEIGSNLFIIPSSVHELLFLPAEDQKESEKIKEMIREINDTKVAPDEILSYSLYYYSLDKKEIIIL